MATLLEVVKSGDVGKLRMILQQGKYPANFSDEWKATPLHYACKEGHLDIVRVLVSEFKVDLGTQDVDGRTPLFYACIAGHLEVVKVLVSEFKANLIVHEKNFGRTPLHYACEKGHLNIAKLLVSEFKADMSIQDYYGCTAPMLAAKNGHVDVFCALLVDYQCPVDNVDIDGWGVLHYACAGVGVRVFRALVSYFNLDVNIKDNSMKTPLHVATEKSKIEIMRALISEFSCHLNVGDQNGQTPLHYACKRDDLDLVWALVNANCNVQDNCMKTPLHMATLYRKKEVMRVLISDFSCDLNVWDRHGQTPLHYACKEDDLDLVQVLVGADCNVQDKKLKTPLHVASEHGNTEVVRALVREFNCNLNVVDQHGQTPLHYACKRDDLDIVRAVVGANCNVQDKKMKTPLHVASEQGNTGVVRVLVNEFGCNLNVVDQHGQTPLHYACKRDDLDLVQALAGADCNVQDIYKNTPLHVATLYGQNEVVKALISDFSCNLNMVNLNGKTPLHYVCDCEDDDLDIIQALVDADCNVQDKEMKTPLHLAIESSTKEVVRVLVGEFSCNLNVVDQDGQTPLHYACKKDDLNLVQALAGADCNVQDEGMKTPLHVATEKSTEEVVGALVSEFGCNLNVVDQHGQTPLHTACKRGDLGLVKALKSANCNIQDNLKQTPFCVAATDELMLALIKEFVFDLSAPGPLGRTPLHLASLAGHHKTVQALLKFTSPLVTDEEGNTPLHLASEKGHTRTMQSLLDANAPVLVRNNNGQTTKDIAPFVSRNFLEEYLNSNRQHVLADYYKMSKHAKKKYSGSHYITRVFVLGFPGAGKSSFIESLKRDGFFDSFRKVSESSVPPHTAGIIPSIHMSKQYGRVMFYDFAGDAEYYSSHAAFFESLATSKKGDNIFIIVVDLRRDNATLETNLHYWFSFIQYQKFSNASFLVVGSHLDQCNQQSKCLDEFCTTMQQTVKNIKHFKLDCRDPRSNQISKFRKQIFTWVNESQKYEISSEAQLLLGLLEKDFSAVTACTVQTLISHIKDSGVWLPVEPKLLYQILLELHEVGVLLLLGDYTRGSDHVILKISKLTNKVHELLFAESALSNLKNALQATSHNIGILPQKFLFERFQLPSYITIDCLVHLQYCQQINRNDVGLFSLEQDSSTSQSFLFFPALCSVDKSLVSWDESPSNSFSIGWLALCTNPHDYFPPRFLHVLLLRLVYGFTLSPAQLQTAHVSPEHSRRCTMWKKGVHWKMEEGVDFLVELVNESKGVVVLTKSSVHRAENNAKAFTKVLSCVMEAKSEFCHSTRPEFFLLDSIAEADYLNEDHLFAMSDVERALESPEGKGVIISVSGRGEMELSKLQCMRGLTHWNALFPITGGEVLRTLEEVVNKLFDLGLSLGAPWAFLESLRADFPFDINQRRIGIVSWWMKSSSKPPCWYSLVEALKDIERKVLAGDMRKEHGLHIELQEKLLDEKTQALKPDEKFLHSLSGVVGSKWPSLAVSLELSKREIEELKQKTELPKDELAFQMLKMWATRKEATYGQLCHKLKTISLFVYSR